MMFHLFSFSLEHDIYMIILFLQAHEVLKLLIQLLPVVARDHEVPLTEEKSTFLMENPNFLKTFGNDMLHVLIQVGC